MADPYQKLTGTPVGKFLVKNLGLPDPTPLKRYTPGESPLTGTFLTGGAGGLVSSVVAAVTAAGGAVHTERAEDVRYAGLVFDASGIDSSDGLAGLRDFFGPVMRSLARCPHVIVLGHTPGEISTGSARIAQRALEGFTRSLGKEIGGGGTVSLVYVDPAASDRLSSTVVFLLSPKSAYVSGQVVRITTAVSEPSDAVPDPLAPLAGKVALVTGASRGIGEATARILHRDGATIVGVDRPQTSDELQRLMTELGGDAIMLDITSVDAPQRIARALLDRQGGVDIVVHNAGINRDRRLANMDKARWSSVIDVNMRAPELITSQLLDDEVVRRNGRVVGVASIAGIAGNIGQTNYATSKAGVIGFVDATAPVAAKNAVTVNAVAPGFIETQMTASVPLMTREFGRRLNSMSQGGLPVDVAETVAWFAHPGSYGVTGNVVRVCGQSLLGA
ncbi:MAG: 3-oxoacyl-ACP reductase [Propionibacteriales bacterium]|nr:3-oxoacyl-ACP reductase [Propionibacteriales bacterium]